MLSTSDVLSETASTSNLSESTEVEVEDPSRLPVLYRLKEENEPISIRPTGNSSPGRNGHLGRYYNIKVYVIHF